MIARKFLLYSILCWALASCIPEEDIFGPGSIEGVVVTKSDKKSENVKVILQSDSFKDSIITDGEGRFVFSEIPSGDNYEPFAYPFNYQPYHHTLSIYPNARLGIQNLTITATKIITFEKTFGGIALDEGLSVQQTTDGGYILVGNTDSKGSGLFDFYVIKLDNMGII